MVTIEHAFLIPAEIDKVLNILQTRAMQAGNCHVSIQSY